MNNVVRKILAAQNMRDLRCLINLPEDTNIDSAISASHAYIETATDTEECIFRLKIFHLCNEAAKGRAHSILREEKDIYARAENFYRLLHESLGKTEKVVKFYDCFLARSTAIQTLKFTVLTLIIQQLETKADTLRQQLTRTYSLNDRIPLERKLFHIHNALGHETDSEPGHSFKGLLNRINFELNSFTHENLQYCLAYAYAESRNMKRILQDDHIILHLRALLHHKVQQPLSHFNEDLFTPVKHNILNFFHKMSFCKITTYNMFAAISNQIEQTIHKATNSFKR